ncbi:two-component sensor histidine kinase [Kibdelosporangium aridum]|uniref:histidine kinase n=2 Tax=Kibdelosporangium aridum TaxID=2030 RepID=A0A428Z417_KIBAR|nr:two-component sensor histidine kinase [Kibdelosporangium aridum]
MPSLHILSMRDRPVGIAVNAVLGVVFAAALAVTAYAIADTWGAGYWVFGCVTGAVVSVLAMTCRHQVWAVGAGLGIAAVTILVAQIAHLPAEPGPAMALGLSVLIGSATRTLATPWAVAVAAGGLAVVASTWLTDTGTTVAGLNSVAWLAAVGTGLGLRLLDIRRRAAAEQVRRDERMELARELHDIVAHHITGIVLHAQAARIVRRRDPDQLDESLTGIETASSEALAAMRRVVGLLRDTDDAAPATPGPEQLGELVTRFTGPPVRLRLPEGEPGWPPEVTSTVYRIVQESLTNIARHAAHAHSVAVDVTQDRHTITVEVTDDAPPAPARYHRRGGYGLVGMRERVEALGGTLRAGPRTGAGWTVHATLPTEELR